MEIKSRMNYNLEFSPIIIRAGSINLEKESGFFYLDDPIVLYSNTLSFNESYQENSTSFRIIEVRFEF